MPLPLPDPYIVKGKPGQEVADGFGTQRNFDAIKAVLDPPVGVVRYVGEAGNPAFAGTWVNFDTGTPGVTSGMRAAHFYKANGRVYLAGAIKSGTSGTTAFTLPSGYLPLNAAALASPVEASGGVAQLDVGTTGNVTPTSQVGNVNTYVFLDGISFRHA